MVSRKFSEIVQNLKQKEVRIRLPLMLLAAGVLFILVEMAFFLSRWGLSIPMTIILGVASGLLLVGFLLGAYLYFRSKRPLLSISERPKQAEIVSQPEAVKESSRFPRPSPPDTLVEACLAGKCILFAGAGLSAQAGLPTWIPFVRGLLDWANKRQLIDTISADSL